MTDSLFASIIAGWALVMLSFATSEHVAVAAGVLA